VLIKEILDVFSQANKSYDDLIKNMDLPALQKSLDKKAKFRFDIEGVGTKVSRDTQTKIIESFAVLPFDKANVDLSNYEVAYKIIENGPDQELYFGERVAYCRTRDKDETYYAKYDLKLRPYLGPTSTDHELALLMAN
jgi:tRNA G10  N-methylase Trm11